MSPAESLALALRLIAHPFTSTAELTEADRATLAEAANAVTRLERITELGDRLAAELHRIHAGQYCEDGCEATYALHEWKEARHG